MILAVATLILVVILALAYIQVARLDRAGAHPTDGHIDIVAAAVRKVIRKRLMDDLLGPDGHFLDPRHADEPYDYPWTYGGAGFHVGLKNPGDGGPPGARVAAGTRDDREEAPELPGDDMWLASSVPDFSDQARPAWPHLTNLNGVYLRIPSPENTDTGPGAGQPLEYQVHNNPAAPSAWLFADSADLNGDGSADWFITDNRETGSYNALDEGYDPRDGDPTSDTDPWMPMGADADGDGIPDSRWTWAPVRQIGGTKYVMAVRIVDNSSMVNVNTALSMVNADSQGRPVYLSGVDSEPQWWNPSELDLGSFFLHYAERLPESPSYLPFYAYTRDLRALLNYRFNTGRTSNPTSKNDAESLDGLPRKMWVRFLARGDRDTEFFSGSHVNIERPDETARSFLFHPGRRLYWELAASRYDNYPLFPYPLPRFQMVDEMTLRYHNGLARSDQGTDVEKIPLAEGPPTRDLRFMRKGLDQFKPEWTHVDALRNLRRVWGLPIHNEHDLAETAYKYYAHNPRLRMTTRSGAALHAPRIPGAEAARVLKKDINRQFIETRDARGLAEEILKVYRKNPPSDWPPGIDSAVEFSRQFAVNIIDYADADSRVTHIDPDGSMDQRPPVFSGDESFGLEALPLLTEVYVEREYEANIAEGRWEEKNPASYAIESRSPYSIDRSNLLGTTPWTPGARLMVNDKDWGFSRHAVRWRDANGEDMDGLQCAEVHWWPHYDGWYSYDSRFPNGDPRPSYHYGSGRSEQWPNNTETGEATGQPVPVTVELRPILEDGRVMPWAYSRTENSLSMPENIPFEAGIPPIADGQTSFRQHVSLGNADLRSDWRSEPPASAERAVAGFGFSADRGYGWLNIATVAPDEFVEKDKTLLESPERDRRIFQINHAPKEGGAPGDVPDSDLSHNQLRLSDRGALLSVGELMHIPVIGPDPEHTLGEAWAGADSVDDFLLDFSSMHLMVRDNPRSNYAVPHAVALLNRFTVLSPGADGKDNDGDGDTDERGPDGLPTEQFLPGTINLNTVSGNLKSLNTSTPTHLLWSVLPIPNEAVRESVIRAIVNYRDGKLEFGDASDGRATEENGLTAPDYRASAVKGIAHLAELMNAVGHAATGRGAAGQMDLLARDGEDTSKLSQPGDGPPISTEFIYRDIGIEHHPGVGGARDGVIDDREEAAMIVKWLMQVASVRSDIYTAYVLIRGYPADDFRKGPVERKRFFLVLDRSQITDDSDQVKVLAAFGY